MNLLHTRCTLQHLKAAALSALLMIATMEGRLDMLADLAAAGAHDPVRLANAVGDTVRSLLHRLHGKELHEVGLKDEEGLLAAAEDDNVELVRRCLEIKTDIDCASLSHRKRLFVCVCMYVCVSDWVVRSEGPGSALSNRWCAVCSVGWLVMEWCRTVRTFSETHPQQPCGVVTMVHV